MISAETEEKITIMGIMLCVIFVMVILPIFSLDHSMNIPIDTAKDSYLKIGGCYTNVDPIPFAKEENIRKIIEIKGDYVKSQLYHGFITGWYSPDVVTKYMMMGYKEVTCPMSIWNYVK